jgi:hypothetical protein
MPVSKQNELSQELVKSLESTVSLMNELLGDIKDNATSLATLKVKLESLSSSVETLSHIVRDGNGKGSMVTRMALVEQSISHIESAFDEFKLEVDSVIKDVRREIAEERQDEKYEETKEKEFKREKLIEKLKLAAVVAPGAIALAITIIKMIMGIE